MCVCVFKRERERESNEERKFYSGAFICSLNEMRMHYTWIAEDINFLAWTCSAPRGLKGGRVSERERGPPLPGRVVGQGGAEGVAGGGHGGRPAHESPHTPLPRAAVISPLERVVSTFSR